MNIDEYVELSAKKIRNRKQREQFKKEMRNHILDRVEYYTDSGYDEETAIEKAIDHMGSAETVGEEMGRVHRSILDIIIDILAALLFPFVILVAFFIVTFFVDKGNLGNHFLSEFIFFLVLPFFSVTANRKNGHQTIMILNIIMSTLYIVFRIYTKAVCSQNLFVLWLIVSGQTSEGLPLLHRTWLKSDSIPLIAATLIMFAVIEGIQIYYFMLSRKTSPRPTDNAIKRHLKRGVNIMTFVSFVITLFAGIYYFRTPTDYYPLDSVYFVDCDEMTDIRTVDYEKNGFPLCTTYTLSELSGFQGTNWNGIDDGFLAPEFRYYPTDIRHTSFGKQVIKHTYRADKRYVAVIPMITFFDENGETYTPDYEHAKWFDTTRDKVLTGKIDGEYEDEAEYEITLTDNKKFIEAKQIYHINQSNKNR